MYKLFENSSNRDGTRKVALAGFTTREEADEAKRAKDDALKLMALPGCFYTVEEIKLADVIVGETFNFYSSLEGTDSAGISPRKYTGESVTVIEDVTEDNAKDDGLSDDERESMYLVRAYDGTVFCAWESELNGDIQTSGIYFEEYPEFNFYE